MPVLLSCTSLFFGRLLPLGLDDSALKSIVAESAMRNILALFSAESGSAPVNPPELIKQANPQVRILDVRSGSDQVSFVGDNPSLEGV